MSVSELFENQRAANLTSAIELVEQALVELGHAQAAEQIAAPGALRAWRVFRGSALVEITLIDRPDSAHLRVAAAIMSLDGGVDRQALFARLLGLNGSHLVGCAFALSGDRVSLVGQRSTRDLDQSEVKSLIGDIVRAADELDDLLIAEFNGLRT